MKTVASACGFAFGTCIKFYLFSMLPAVWFWFPAFFIEEYFNRKGD